jgi:hypothetical protein
VLDRPEEAPSKQAQAHIDGVHRRLRNPGGHRRLRNPGGHRLFHWKRKKKKTKMTLFRINLMRRDREMIISRGKSIGSLHSIGN